MDRPAFRFRFGTAEFDEARFELRVAGLPVDVERRALEVLSYLLRHAGEVVTKDELLREVWAGRPTVDKVLTNAITKLRRALGEANGACISTQARVGYRLDGVVQRTAVGRQVGSHLALAAGQPVPGRPNLVLQRQLGRTAGSEVWLAEHAKTRETRVYKFALDADRLRALKREVTLLRLLQEGLGDSHHFVEVLDWNFEHAPYFLECRYAGETLDQWAAQHLAGLSTEERLALFLQVADAVAAAHAMGVLHKDLKPANVLVTGDRSAPQVRLTDFGSGHLLEPDRLQQLGITRLGLTVEDQGADGSSSGTPLYLAPELFAGQAPSVKSDVYALGMLLFQLLAGRVGLPMAPGWEADIDDELLREDLRRATDGNPERRLGSVTALSDGLRRLADRRAEIAERQREQAAARHDREALARANARRPYVRAVLALLAAGVVTTGTLLWQALQARNDARTELARANALARFLNDDLIGRSNPLVSAKGPDATLREVLLSARERVPARFAAQPETAATLHGSLAALFKAVDLLTESEAEARQALGLLDTQGLGQRPAAAQARAVLVRVLAQRGKLDEAQTQLDLLDRHAAPSADPMLRGQVAAAHAALHQARAEYAKAAQSLRAAVDNLRPAEPDNAALLDPFRLDLIQVLTMAGHDNQALDEGRRLITEARARPGNSDLLVALTQLAMVRAQGEDHAAAEQLLSAAQPVIAARLGIDHSKYLSLLNEKFAVAFRRADWPQALVAAEEVHGRIRAKVGDDHTATYVTLTNWARALDEAGRPADALAKAQRAHAQLTRLVGPTKPQSQDAALLLAQVLLETGHLDRAWPLLAQLDAQVLESSRANGAWASGISALRGVALLQRGDAAAARPLLDAALQGLREEERLAQPSRLYLMAKAARARLP